MSHNDALATALALLGLSVGILLSCSAPVDLPTCRGRYVLSACFAPINPPSPLRKPGSVELTGIEI